MDAADPIDGLHFDLGMDSLKHRSDKQSFENLRFNHAFCWIGT